VDEWYKAAFYKSGGLNTGYWTYATKSDTAPGGGKSDTVANKVDYNSDNYDFGEGADHGDLVDAGFYTLSPSSYGTFDQSGNLYEWNEEKSVEDTSKRWIFGGGFKSNSAPDISYDSQSYSDPNTGRYDVGFRVASSNTIFALPGQATAPNPGNGAVNVILTPTLSWTVGSNSISHDVYFGTNQANVTNATRTSAEYKGNQFGTSYAPGTLLAKTVYYWRIDEVGTDGTTKGVIWSFTTDFYTEKFQDITVGAAGAWTDVDLSSYGVLANQVVEIGLRNSNTTTARLAGVRIKGSALNRYVTLRAAATTGWDTSVMQVKVDANKKIQAYAANTTDVHIILLGVWNKGDYTEKFQALTIGTTGAWTDSADLSAYGVSASQIVEILAANTSTTAYIAGVRAKGLALDRKLTLRTSASSASECLVMKTQVDASRKLQVWKGNAAVTFTLLGYWTTAPGTYTEKFVDVGKPTSSATWYTRSLSGQGVPAYAACEFLIANAATANANNVGVCAVGSGLSRLYNLHRSSASTARSCSMMHVLTDSSSQIQQYLQNQANTVNFYLLGYWN